MDDSLLHRWDVTPKEAVAIQGRLQDQVVLEDRFGPVRFVAGVDVGFEDDNTVTRAAVAVLSFPELEFREHSLARLPTTFPYIPGLLSFREIPAVLEALSALPIRPDLLLCDGQGLAHPRRFGIACHIGVLTGIPAIGVGKSRLVGSHEPVPETRGDWMPLWHRGEVVGAALRTRPPYKPLYISPGHLISLESSVEYVMRCTTKYRLPETTRWAHRFASSKES